MSNIRSKKIDITQRLFSIVVVLMTTTTTAIAQEGKQQKGVFKIGRAHV